MLSAQYLEPKTISDWSYKKRWFDSEVAAVYRPFQNLLNIKIDDKS